MTNYFKLLGMDWLRNAQDTLCYLNSEGCSTIRHYDQAFWEYSQCLQESIDCAICLLVAEEVW